MIVLTGASASGKTVTALDLQKRHGLVKAITTTTREKRVGETDGVEYFFISKEEFEKRLAENKFVEHSIYNGNYYGCGVDQISDNKIVVLDPNGLHSFLKLKDKNIVSFLLIADENTRKSRMESRGDKEANIKQRIENDVNDFSLEKIGKVDFVINTEKYSIEEVSDLIYKLYSEKLKEESR
jgi:guanylate kinase